MHVAVVRILALVNILTSYPHIQTSLTLQQELAIAACCTTRTVVVAPDQLPLQSGVKTIFLHVC